MFASVINDGNDIEEYKEPMFKKQIGENIVYEVFRTHKAVDDCLKE